MIPIIEARTEKVMIPAEESFSRERSARSSAYARFLRSWLICRTTKVSGSSSVT
jgi:hypothetical protein